ncbi:discoidin domain-containing protein [Paenibacillus sp. HB172176]|uniref:discoidin domain-containing protein n=1 Tax=Paenibacillus sp. HB172176 TaxID=2493690 RepID=UPI00143C36FB|nr:discoidin domain-containing protein [Paenibacillus sp. HB172176]
MKAKSFNRMTRILAKGMLSVLVLQVCVFGLQSFLVAPSAAASSGSENLLQNGGFEQGTVGWIPWGQAAEITVDESVYKEGSAALKVVLSDKTAGSIQNVNVQGGTMYSLKFWLKMEPLNENATFYVRATYVSSDGSKETVQIPGTSLTGTGDWRFIESHFQVPEDVIRINLNPYFSAKGTYWLDDMSLSEYIPVTSISLNPETLSLDIGEAAAIQAIIAPGNATDQAITWTTSNSEVATVVDGTVTGLQQGIAIITAASDEFSASCLVKVDVSYELEQASPEVVTDEDIAVQGALEPYSDGGAPLRYEMLAGPERGQTELNGDGTWEYRPDSNSYGTDSFTAAYWDQNGGFGTVQVQLVIQSVNDAPVVENEQFLLTEYENVSGQIQAEDIEGDELFYAIGQSPEHGELTLLQDGQWTFVSDGYVGKVEFQIDVSDSQGGHSPAVIQLFTGPAGDTVMADLRQQHPVGEHPRLLATSDDFDAVSQRMLTDTTFQQWYAEVEQEADDMLQDPLPVYDTSQDHGSGNFLNSISRTELDRMLHWGFMYQMTGDTAYVDRAWQDLQATNAFVDWSPAQFLATAELSFAYAIAYDWFYDAWTEQQRESLYTAISDKAFDPALKVYLEEPATGIERGWFTSSTNKNAVVNSALAMSALAIADEAPVQSKEILEEALQSVQEHLDHYAPDGASEEGPMYWNYAMQYLVDLLSSMDASLGTDYGFSDKEGMAESSYYPLYMTSPTGSRFNYSDADSSGMFNDENFWMANRYNVPELGGFTLQSPRIGVKRLLWAQPENYQTPAETGTALDKLFTGREEVASMRNAWGNDEALYVGVKGGDNQSSHGDLDIGSFVLDALGVRWAMELGVQAYGSTDLWSFDEDAARWTYYKKRAEGNNTIVINPDSGPDQNPYAVSSVTQFVYGSQEAFAIVDLTPAYEDQVVSARRGVALKDHRSSVLMQDELETKKASDIWWFMHTAASQVEIGQDGRTAVLKQGNKRLQVSIQSPANAEFSLMDAVPLPSSPNPAENDSTTGIRKLAIHLENAVNPTIAVSFTPYLAGYAPDSQNETVLPLEDWTISERQAAPLESILVNGGTLPNFSPNQRFYEETLPIDEDNPPIVAAVPQSSGDQVVIEQAEGLPGTAVITVIPADTDKDEAVYYVSFKREIQIGVPASATKWDVLQASASDAQYAEGNIPENAVDGNMSTRWSASGSGQWLQLDLGQERLVNAVSAAWLSGNARKTWFDIQVSQDAETWQTVYEGESSGISADSELYTFNAVSARYIRIVGYGNSVNTWNSINEAGVYWQESNSLATDAPANPVLSNDNGYDTGLRDGNYTITMNQWWGNNGTTYKLYENGVLIDTRSLIDYSPAAQTAATVLTGRHNGTYVYSCELMNSYGTASCDPLTVAVVDALPGNAMLSSDNWDGDGNYNVRMDMWWGTNASIFELYENGKLLQTIPLVESTPGAQSAQVTMTGKQAGTYEYYGKLINAAGETVTAELVVHVS